MKPFRVLGPSRGALLQWAAPIIATVLIVSHGRNEAQPVPSLSERSRTAPPPSPGILYGDPSEAKTGPELTASGKTLYSIGELTDDEQAYLEFINQARPDPAAEGIRMVTTTDADVLDQLDVWSVDLDQVLNAPDVGFNNLVPAAVLVPNPLLTVAARRHTQDMFDKTFQGHVGSDGSRIGDRVQDAGYSFSTTGENVFSNARSPFHGHAGFNIDWGAGPGGIQDPPGHRNSIHNPAFTEIGVGVINGSMDMVANPGPGGQNVGPQLVTQVLASRFDITPFVTGVAYYDLNGNNFYDGGEGIGGVDVQVDASSFFATTVDSGGYGVPVSGNGSYVVTFSGAGFDNEVLNVTISDNQNVKVDFAPTYMPPSISGPDVASLNQNNSYAFTQVAGATAYEWQQARLGSVSGVEGAETGLDDFDAQTTGSYDPLDSNVTATGSRAFRLVHETFADQFLTWNRKFRPGVNGTFRFKSRLRVASEAQIARVEISSDGGGSWVEAWAQPGSWTQQNPNSGETSFTVRSIDLAAYAGAVIQIRFVYHYVLGELAFNQTDANFGWYFDDLEFTDTQEVFDPVIANVGGGSSFQFNPQTMDTFSLQVRPMVGGRWFPFGPEKLVTAQDGSGGTNPVISLIDIGVASGQATITFDVISGSASSFELFSAPSPIGPWNVDASAVIIPSGDEYLAITSTNNADEQYYQVSGQ